jgi:phosphoribosylamine--glycine ligase
MMVSGGYPEDYQKGYKIEGLDAVTDSLVFHAGTEMDGTDVVSAGGRVLAVTSYGRSIEQALDKSYRSIEDIQFKDAYFRSDIGFDLIQLLNK